MASEELGATLCLLKTISAENPQKYSSHTNRSKTILGKWPSEQAWII